MSSIDRPLSGAPLHFRLGDEHRSEHIDSDLLEKAGRTARTLVKEGPLRVTLVSIGAGGNLAPHRANGPITVHVLSGEVRLRTADGEWVLSSGDLLSLGAEIEHDVVSEAGGVFLLTVVAPSTS